MVQAIKSKPDIWSQINQNKEYKYVYEVQFKPGNIPVFGLPSTHFLLSIISSSPPVLNGISLLLPKQIFDSDFNEFARLDDSITIYNLSRIRIRDRNSARSNDRKDLLKANITGLPSPCYLRSPNGIYNQMLGGRVIPMFDLTCDRDSLNNQPTSSHLDLNGEAVPMVVNVNPHTATTATASTDDDSCGRYSLINF